MKPPANPSLQASASRILAAAICEILPGSQICHAGETLGGFYCEFIFKHPYSSEILTLLEERLRQIVREKRAIRVLEMVPFSAAELLKKNDQPLRAQEVRQQEGLVRLFSMGAFVDWSEDKHLPHAGLAGILRLLEIEPIHKHRFRIQGIAALSKESLRAAIKRLEEYPTRKADVVGERLGLWHLIEGSRVYLPRGLAVKRRWADFWRSQWPLFEVEGGHHRALCRAKSRASVMEFGQGVLQVYHDLPETWNLERAKAPGFDDRNSPHISNIGRVTIVESRELSRGSKSKFLADRGINSFADPLATCSSFLQTMHKSLTILGFTYGLRLSGRKRKGSLLLAALEQSGLSLECEEGELAEPAVEFLVHDALHVPRIAAMLTQILGKEACLSMCVEVERNLDLLLEKDGGSLPRWLTEELIENK